MQSMCFEHIDCIGKLQCAKNLNAPNLNAQKLYENRKLTENFFLNVRKIGMHKTDTKIEQILKMCEKLNGFEKCTNKCCQCLGLISLIEKSHQQQNIEHKDLDKKIILEIKKKSEIRKIRNSEIRKRNSEIRKRIRKIGNSEIRK